MRLVSPSKLYLFLFSLKIKSKHVEDHANELVGEPADKLNKDIPCLDVVFFSYFHAFVLNYVFEFLFCRRSKR